MIILFCAYDRPGHIASGPNAWIQRLIPDLRERYGLNIHTFFIYSGNKEDCPTLSYFINQNLPIIHLNRDELPYVEDQVKYLLKLVKKEKITVVVANVVIPAFYAGKYLKRFDIPVIGVLHSHDAFHKGVLKKFIHGNKEDQFSAVVSVSEYIEKIRKSNENNIPNYVIPCGTPLTKNEAQWNDDGALKVIYAGRLVVEAKQIIKLTHAFCEASKLDDRLFFNIFGDGDGDEENSIKEIIQSRNCRKQVQLNKALPPSAIIQKIAEHQVFTLMSDYEGMPLALMEAMSCGVVPVCLEEASGVNEIIEHGKNGFIVKDRLEDYQRHLQLLIEKPSLWKEMSINAKKTIEEKYSAEITHAKWVDLFNNHASIKTKKIIIPLNIIINSDLLYYGDNRKPPFKNRYVKRLSEFWLRLRMILRPRNRLRKLLNNKFIKIN
jgi:colanic acid/amylovoran biosynthesis glycosyltransferase